MRPFLETERLILRHFTGSDADHLVELDGDPEVMRHLTGGRPTPRESIETDVLPRFLDYHRRFTGYGFFAAIKQAGGDFLGWFHFRPRPDDPPGTVELGYRLRRSAWGKGYATEGSRELIRKGFTEFGVEVVYAQTMAVNARSRRVMEKAGLRYVRTFHREWAEPLPGTQHGEVEYALARRDWQAERSDWPEPQRRVRAGPPAGSNSPITG
ncbi:MAG TPA: GNAT family N-acetyltransferase [Micromonosporaceae bacterium]